jgi:hypothetical protein
MEKQVIDVSRMVNVMSDETVVVTFLPSGRGFRTRVELRPGKAALEIVVKTGLHHTLSTGDKAEFLVDLPNDEDAPADEEEGNDDEGEDDDGGEAA